MYFHKRYILPGTLWPARQQPEQYKVKRYGLPTLPQCRIVPTMEQKVTKLFPPGNIVSKKGFMFSHLSKAINNFKSGYKNYTTLVNIFWHSFPMDFEVVKYVFFWNCCLCLGLLGFWKDVCFLCGWKGVQVLLLKTANSHSKHRT